MNRINQLAFLTDYFKFFLITSISTIQLILYMCDQHHISNASILLSVSFLAQISCSNNAMIHTRVSMSFFLNVKTSFYSYELCNFFTKSSFYLSLPFSMLILLRYRNSSTRLRLWLSMCILAIIFCGFLSHINIFILFCLFAF